MTARLRRALASIVDLRPWLHVLRLVHYYNYSHVAPLRRAQVDPSVAMAPNVSIRNGSGLMIGPHAHIGERCALWAGRAAGRIEIGEHALLGPQVFITAANYQLRPDVPVMHQPMDEAPVRIGRDVWLGARVIVLPGVTIGDGCVVGAGAIVTRSLEPWSVAVGAPARVVARRG